MLVADRINRTDYVIRQAGTDKEMPVALHTLPHPKNVQDRYEIGRLLEAQMDALFGEHLATHVWLLEPALDVVFGTNVEGDMWWRGRSGG